MKYVLNTFFALLLVFGCYSLYDEIDLILASDNIEPFFGITMAAIFVITGLIGIIFTRISNLSSIVTAAGSLLLTFGLAISAIEIDAKLYGVSKDPGVGYFISFVFFFIGLTIIVYGSKIKKSATQND